ncbi:hypothetical protein [Arcticibacter tournemirensis]
MNIYYLRARLFPSLLTSIPMLVFVNATIIKLYHTELFSIMEILPLLSSLGLSVALVFLLTQINRVLSKEIFQRFYFQEETNMPTTNFLLWSDSFFEKQIKEKLHYKIESKFGVQLMTAQDEQHDVYSHRKRIVAAVSLIRNSLRSDRLLLQHNIEYGFFRNLLGGCVIALLFALTITVYSYISGNKVLLVTGTFFLVIYLAPILLSKKILLVFGRNYAKILLEQFLSAA